MDRTTAENCQLYDPALKKVVVGNLVLYFLLELAKDFCCSFDLNFVSETICLAEVTASCGLTSIAILLLMGLEIM